MTSSELARAIGAVNDTDRPDALARLRERLRRREGHTVEVEALAGVIQRKIERLTREN